MTPDDRQFGDEDGLLTSYNERTNFPSSQKGPTYPDDLLAEVDERPKIFLMGLRKSGKSSIQKVVFDKMQPTDTAFLESTHKIEKNDVSESSFIRFQIWDFPGHIDFCQKSVFSATSAVIFIIDAQDDCSEALARLQRTLDVVFRTNINIKLEVFIHKVDCLTDERKINIQRDITQYVTGLIDDFREQTGINGGSVGFHLTTIYDHSIFEAFSKVVQKLIPHLDAFEHLLDIFIANSMVEKAFLLDVTSKIYLATDTNAVDLQTYELCCDMIDVVVDIASIYTSPFSEQTASTIMLNTGTVLYLRGVNQYMALACLMHEDALENMGSIEYNFQVIKSGLKQMLEVNRRATRLEAAALLSQSQANAHADAEQDKGAANSSEHFDWRSSVEFEINPT